MSDLKQEIAIESLSTLNEPTFLKFLYFDPNLFLIQVLRLPTKWNESVFDAPLNIKRRLSREGILALIEPRLQKLVQFIHSVHFDLDLPVLLHTAHHFS